MSWGRCSRKARRLFSLPGSRPSVSLAPVVVVPGRSDRSPAPVPRTTGRSRTHGSVALVFEIGGVYVRRVAEQDQRVDVAQAHSIPHLCAAVVLPRAGCEGDGRRHPCSDGSLGPERTCRQHGSLVIRHEVVVVGHRFEALDRPANAESVLLGGLERVPPRPPLRSDEDSSSRSPGSSRTGGDADLRLLEAADGGTRCQRRGQAGGNHEKRVDHRVAPGGRGRSVGGRGVRHPSTPASATGAVEKEAPPLDRNQADDREGAGRRQGTTGRNQPP